MRIVTDLILEALEAYLDSLESDKDLLYISGRAVKADNSYCNSDTGYNYVSDVEYTDEYEDLIDKIEEVKNLIAQFDE